MTNPYTPPQPPSNPDTGSRPLPVAPIIGMIVGAIFLGGVFFCIGTIVDLHRRFPDMSDPSPDVDAYWPAVVEIIMYVYAGIAAMIGIPTFLYSLIVFRHRRAASSA